MNWHENADNRKRIGDRLEEDFADQVRCSCGGNFEHWFIPANPDGLYKKANYFRLTKICAWQPRTYFGRAQLISIFDVVHDDENLRSHRPVPG